MVIRIAVRRYIQSAVEHRTDEVDVAIDNLFMFDLLPNLGIDTTQVSNLFRERYCYIQPTDQVLRKHEPSLRLLYNKYAYMDATSEHDRLRDKFKMSITEWLKMISDLGLLDGEFTMRYAKLCFSWSRMKVIDEATEKSRVRLTNMTFEDFLEGIVRVAGMKVPRAGPIGCKKPPMKPGEL